MLTKRLVSVMLSAVVILSLLTLPCDAAVSISAKAAVLFDPGSDSFLYEKYADKRLPMASTTKIMTALIALESGDLDEEFTVDDRAVGTEGSSIYLKYGEAFSTRELVYALLLSSANDAASAIAYHVSGSIEAFADEMNRKAEEIGLCDTHFCNPHGLDDEEHYTTAKDLAVLAAYALENPDFFEICSQVSAKIENAEGGVRALKNHNKLLRLYEGTVGVKTGFTKKSGRCLVSAAERGGLRLIAVTLSAPDDWNDHISMFEYGFATLGEPYLFERERYRALVPVLGSDSCVPVTNTESFCITQGAKNVEYRVSLPRFLTHGVRAGDKIGEIIFYEGEKTVGRLGLFALRSTE